MDPTLYTLKGLATTEGRTGLKERWKAEAATLNMKLSFANELLTEGADMRKAFWVTVARKEREGAEEEEEVIQVADLAENMGDIGEQGIKEHQEQVSLRQVLQKYLTHNCKTLLRDTLRNFTLRPDGTPLPDTPQFAIAFPTYYYSQLLS